MTKLYKDLYRIESTRLKGWDYRNSGIYFITICTKNHENYFGEIINSEMNLNFAGQITKKNWITIPGHFKNIKIDTFIVMPNHLHGVLILGNVNPNNYFLDIPVDSLHATNLQDENETNYYSKISPKSKSISTIIRSFKSACTMKLIKQILISIFLGNLFFMTT